MCHNIALVKHRGATETPPPNESEDHLYASFIHSSLSLSHPTSCNQLTSGVFGNQSDFATVSTSQSHQTLKFVLVSSVVSRHFSVYCCNPPPPHSPPPHHDDISSFSNESVIK